MKKTLKFLLSLPQRSAVALIGLYQKSLSPDHSWIRGHYPYGYCRFYPSCSEYTKQAIGKFGFIYGIILGFKRVVNCHPWAKPKFDPVPKNFSIKPW